MQLAAVVKIYWHFHQQLEFLSHNVEFFLRSDRGFAPCGPIQRLSQQILRPITQPFAHFVKELHIDKIVKSSAFTVKFAIKS